MKKNLKKLALNRETLAPLQSLDNVMGGNQISITVGSCTVTLPICCNMTSQQSQSWSVSASANPGGGAGGAAK
jgi:hypothetical protein